MANKILNRNHDNNNSANNKMSFESFLPSRFVSFRLNNDNGNYFTSYQKHHCSCVVIIQINNDNNIKQITGRRWSWSMANFSQKEANQLPLIQRMKWICPTESACITIFNNQDAMPIQSPKLKQFYTCILNERLWTTLCASQLNLVRAGSLCLFVCLESANPQ